MLYVFEDNEAVIKMIIKGRCPTMSHVSRTHRVVLDWLFDRVNLDPKIQIRYIDTKHQIAVIVTEGNFTRDEWNNLLYLFNISHFSLLCCAQNFRLTSCTKTMAKRMQEQEGEDRIVAESKPTTMNLPFSVSTRFSTVNSPIASKSPGIREAWSRQIVDVQVNQAWEEKDIPIPTQRRVLKDGKRMLYWMSVRRNLSRQIKSRNPWTVLAPGYQGHPGTPWNSEESETEGRIWPNHYHASPDCVPHMNKVFSIARQTYGRSPMDDLNDLDVNTTIWVIFVTCHSSSCSPSWTKLYGKFCDLPRINPWSLWDTYYERLRGWSRIRQKLPDWPRLTGSSLCRLQIPKPTSFPTQCCVWEPSVMNQSKPGKAGSNGIWRHAISKIWIESTGSRWSSSGQFSQDSLRWEFSTRWRNQSVNRSISKEGSSSCQCTMTSSGEKGETENFIANALSELLCMLEDSRKDVGRFWGLDPRRNGTEPMPTNRTENGRWLLKAWCSTLLRADILYFVPPAPWKEN